MAGCFMGWRAMARAAVLALSAGWAIAGACAPATCPPEPDVPDADRLGQAVADATDHGMLWRITRDGRTSYLYGSLHLGRLSLAFPGPKMRDALRATDVVALELDVSDPGMPETLKAALDALPPGARQASPELLQRLEKQRQRMCVPAEQLAGMPPMLQAMTLMMSAARFQGLEVMWAQEVVLAGVAKSLGRPVVGLETMAEQMRALLPADPAEAQVVLDQTLKQLEDGSAERMLGRLVDQWAQGRLEELARYESWCECMKTPLERRFMARMLDGRNPHLAKGIDALHRQGKRVFAAVGALHMAGKDGVPRLLERMGYQVKRVY